MTGPEHYAKAERWLLLVQDKGALLEAPDLVSVSMAAAQVHATLALTAATAMRADGYTPAVWAKVMSP